MRQYYIEFANKSIVTRVFSDHLPEVDIVDEVLKDCPQYDKVQRICRALDGIDIYVAKEEKKEEKSP